MSGKPDDASAPVRMTGFPGSVDIEIPHDPSIDYSEYEGLYPEPFSQSRSRGVAQRPKIYARTLRRVDITVWD